MPFIKSIPFMHKNGAPQSSVQLFQISLQDASLLRQTLEKYIFTTGHCSELTVTLYNEGENYTF